MEQQDASLSRNILRNDATQLFKGMWSLSTAPGILDGNHKLVWLMVTGPLSRVLTPQPNISTPTMPGCQKKVTFGDGNTGELDEESPEIEEAKIHLELDLSSMFGEIDADEETGSAPGRGATAE